MIKTKKTLKIDFSLGVVRNVTIVTKRSGTSNLLEEDFESLIVYLKP